MEASPHPQTVTARLTRFEEKYSESIQAKGWLKEAKDHLQEWISRNNLQPIENWLTYQVLNRLIALRPVNPLATTITLAKDVLRCVLRFHRDRYEHCSARARELYIGDTGLPIGRYRYRIRDLGDHYVIEYYNSLSDIPVHTEEIPKIDEQLYRAIERCTNV